MRTQIVAGLGLITVMAACAPGEPQPPPDQPDHALFDSLELAPPPLNRPLAVTTVPAAEPMAQLPGGTASAIALLHDGRPFTGTLDIAGQLTVTSDRIRLDAEGGGTFEVLYRLPSGIGTLPQATGTGSISVTERSGPTGADRRIVVQQEGRPLLSEVWLRSAEPITVDLGGGIRIVQTAVRPSGEGEYTEAPLQALEDQRTIAALRVGTATTLEATTGASTAFVEVSHLFTPSDADVGQTRPGYILRVWVTRAGG